MFTKVAPLLSKGLRIFLLVATFVNTFVLVGLAPEGPVQAKDSDGIAASPATAGDIDRSRTRFEYQLNAGQTARDSIYVLNTGTTPQVVTLYARDAFAGKSGEFLVQAETDQPKDIGSWVTFFNGRNVYSKTIEPKNFMTIPFDVLSPVTASPGDHIGAIVVSAKSVGGQIAVVKRVAVRLYAHVSGQLSPRLQISNVSMKSSANPANPFDSTLGVTYTLENTGNMELSADVSVQPTGLGGVSLQEPTTTRVSGLLPGSKQTVSTTVTGFVQTGFVGASVVFKGVFESDAKGAQVPMGREDVSSFVTPWGWLTAIILLAAFIIGFILIRRFPREKTR